MHETTRAQDDGTGAEATDPAPRCEVYLLGGERPYAVRADSPDDAAAVLAANAYGPAYAVAAAPGAVYSWRVTDEDGREVARIAFRYLTDAQGGATDACQLYLY